MAMAHCTAGRVSGCDVTYFKISASVEQSTHSGIFAFYVHSRRAGQGKREGSVKILRCCCTIVLVPRYSRESNVAS